MNDENKCLLTDFIDSFDASGETNYENAFNLAFQIMSNSIDNHNISGCSAQVILFFTDGAIRKGRM